MKKKTKKISETYKPTENKSHLHTQQQSWSKGIVKSKKAYSRKGKYKWNVNKE